MITKKMMSTFGIMLLCTGQTFGSAPTQPFGDPWSADENSSGSKSSGSDTATTEAINPATVIHAGGAIYVGGVVSQSPGGTFSVLPRGPSTHVIGGMPPSRDLREAMEDTLENQGSTAHTPGQLMSAASAAHGITHPADGTPDRPAASGGKK